MTDLISREAALFSLHNDVGLGTANPAYKCIEALPAAPGGTENVGRDWRNGEHQDWEKARALPAVQPKVKPLVWEGFTHYSTDDDGGPMDGVRMALWAWRALHYRIIRQRGADGLHILNGKSDGIGLAVPTLESAKAAAQADYEARILSALEPAPPATEGGA